MWAWNNPSIVPALQADALKVREYGRMHAMPRLVEPACLCGEPDAWGLAAVANRICGRNGVYRGPAGGTYVFITFGEVEVARGGSGHEPG
jgi:hypothetical protein